MDVLALIPARGGSKGIPRKNLLPLAGKPLLAYSIAHALAAQQVTRVIVSTDDLEIAEVAEGYGAEVIHRPAEFATDTSPDIDTFVHALTYLKKVEKWTPDMVVHLRPTCPIRREGDIDRAIQCLRAQPEADSLRSVSLAKQSAYKQWRMAGDCIQRVYDDDIRHLEYIARTGNTHGKDLWRPYCGEQHSMARQKLDPLYFQNGYIDVMWTATLLDKLVMAGDKVIPFVVEPMPLDLDTPEDIKSMEDALLQLA